MSQIEVERRGAVMHIAINRPEKKNALTAEMYMALADAVERAEGEGDVRVMLLRGKGDAFTAGNDLQDFVQKPWRGQAVPPALRFMRVVASAEKPVVAAVHGVVVGVGTTILLHCDLVYAAENTQFMMPFINLGIVPEAASTVLLPLLAGRQRASELFLLGTPFSAARAYEMGLVNAVVAPDQLLTVASGAAEQLAEKPRAAVLECKKLIKRAFQSEVERALMEEFEVIAGRLESLETREALVAFLEKRKPDFSGF
ncbi:MAG TPA: enoyl-CoA hydratase [Candidatus Binatia bacterium]|nr:enoyl-CoA hydratase [Candidatus Binatia bacterium]